MAFYFSKLKVGDSINIAYKIDDDSLKYFLPVFQIS